MALQKDLALNNGITVPAAYFKVVGANIQNFGMNVIAQIVVAVYINKAWADANNPPILETVYQMQQFDASVDTLTAGAQIYGFLKTLDDFATAVDI